MLLSVFSFVTVCLALGAILLNGMLSCAAYLVELKGTGMSQHFFAVERGPSPKTLADRIMDRYMIIALWIGLAPIGCFILLRIYLQIVQCFSGEQLTEAVAYLQNISLAMLSLLISITIFFSSIRKNHQTFFARHDRIQRYKALFLLSISCWILSAMLGLGIVSEMARPLQRYISALELILLAFAFFLITYIAWVSIKLSFSTQPIDVVQFKKFGIHRHDAPWELRTCNYPGKQELSFSQKYLILDLQKQTARLESSLKRRCRIYRTSNLQVCFSDVTHMRPIWYKRFSILIWLPLMWLVFGFAASVFFPVFKIYIFTSASESILFSQALSVLALCLAFFLRTKPCRQIAVYNTYGSWGYYFTDPSTAKTIYSFSEREFSCSPSKAWLRAVWCILTLFRIELIQADEIAYSSFLSELETSANILSGLQSEVLRIAYCLCCRLGKVECRENSESFQELALSLFAQQLCDAIWMDYSRCATPFIESNQCI